MIEVPEIYTARYFAEGVLATGEIAPVRISLRSPASLGIELPYPLEHGVPALAPEQSMLSEWSQLSAAMWRKLDAIGAEAILERLCAISEAEDGKPLALLCWEDLTRPFKCHRVVVSLWLEEVLQRPVSEITDAGELLTLDRLHKQANRIVFPDRRVRG